MGSAAQEIAYGVLSAYTGQGIGTSIVGQAAKQCDGSVLIAKVSEKNRASERCFEKNSFEKFETNEVRHLAAFGDDHNFNLWLLFIGTKSKTKCHK